MAAPSVGTIGMKISSYENSCTVLTHIPVTYILTLSINDLKGLSIRFSNPTTC